MSVKVGQNGDPRDFNNIDHFVAGESISQGDAVSLNYSDYKIYKASAAAFDHRLNFIGFAMAAATTNNPVQVNVLNVVHEKTGLTASTTYYLSNTQGAIGTAAGTYERVIGRAVSTSKIIRKRGVVSKLFSVAAGTAPCDGIVYFTVTETTSSITVGSATLDVDEYSFSGPVMMGSSFSSNITGSDVAYFAVLDFGSFY